MKKLIALVLTLALSLLCLSVLAEAPAVPKADEVTETAETSTEAGFEGSWITLSDAGFKLLLPSEWYEWEITEEGTAAGLFYAVSADEEGTCGINFYCLDSSDEDYADLEAYAANMAQSYPGAMVLPINGLNFVTYDSEDENTSNLLYFGADNTAYLLEFYPKDNDEFGQTYAMPIAQSITPVE